MIWLTLTVIWIMMLIVHPVPTAIGTGVVIATYALIRIVFAVWEAHRGGP